MSGFTDKKEKQKLAEKLVKSTHFNKTEIESLLKKYTEVTHKLNKQQDSNQKPPKIDRKLFREILGNHFGMTETMMMDSIFRAFDLNKDGLISMDEWIKGLSIFLRGRLSERTKFCFEVYDLNGDGYISREEMFQLLNDCLKSNIQTDEDPEENKRDLVDYALKQLDRDSDSRVSYKDFEEAVNDKELLLECLGPCMPDYRHIQEYQSTFICQNNQLIYC